jgi:pimeloyl-ACP methyl ester carboxylesterase
MEILRTPDDRFADLPGYSFEPHYVDLAGLRMHHVDEGAGPPVLLLHGEPSWSYLYRKMIPAIAAAGLRAVAPDLIGFGRSDKPAARGDYTYQRHMDWLTAFVVALDLRDITLVCQDWGGLLGLRLAAEHPERFTRRSRDRRSVVHADQVHAARRRAERAARPPRPARRADPRGRRRLRPPGRRPVRRGVRSAVMIARVSVRRDPPVDRRDHVRSWSRPPWARRVHPGPRGIVPRAARTPHRHTRTCPLDSTDHS